MNRKLLLIFAAVVFLSNAPKASAQLVSEGRNLLPVWMPCDLSEPNCQSDPRWNDAWKFGDIYLQRQVECSIDASAVNPNNLLAGCIDYSGIDIGNDIQVPFASTSPLVRLKEFLLAKFFDKPQPKPRLPRYSSGSEAWIRGMWSTNGFVTSTPFFVPGAPWANSSEDLNTFYKNVANATSDPLVIATPDGFHMIYMAFKRLSDGSVDLNFMVDWRLVDKNIPDEPGRHSLASKGPPVMIAGGNNGSFGGFHDKPSAVAIPNPTSPAGYDLLVAYTVFTGKGTKNAASHIYVATTRDGGNNWVAEQVSQSTNEVSGTSIVAGLNGQASVFYRGFGTDATIYHTKRASNGNWSKPVSILDKTYPTLMAFDQANVKVDSTSNPASVAENNIAPRSNAFPAAAIAQNGTIFVAVQECADATTGLPRSCTIGGIPQIMLMSSTDGGATFSPRKAADNGPRNPEPDGFGYFWNVGRDNNNVHPQIIPTLNCTIPVGGTSGCLLTYWESRTQGLVVGPDPLNGQPRIVIGGYHRLMDLRGTLLNPNGTVNRSFQISKYPYRPLTKLVDQFNQPRPENVNDIARVNEIILPNGTRSCLGPAGVEPPLPGLDPGCIPRLNFYRPQSGGGVLYFAGDYFALAKSASWVRSSTGTPKIPTDPLEVPWIGWHAITTTNQNVVPPTTLLPSKGGAPAINQISDFTKWTPGQSGLPACTVGGSRNTDSYMFDISLGLLVTTPVTNKTTPSPGDAPYITFPVQVWNNSNQVKTVRFTVDPNTAASSSFSKTDPNVKTGLSTVNPNSSTVHILYVTYSAGSPISPIRVQVTETNSDGTPMTGAIPTAVTFNATGTPQASAGVQASSVSVSDPITGSIQAGSIQAGSIQAALAAANITGSIQAGSIQAGSIQAGSIQAAWVVEASGDPTQPKTAFTNVDAAFLQDYNFRTRIYQLTSVGACVDATGNTSVQYQARQVGNGSIQAGSIQAGSIQAGSIQAIAAANGFPNDPFIDNALFLPKPGKKTAPPPLPAGSDCRIGDCIEAKPPQSEFTVVQLIAEAKTSTPSIVFDPVIFPPAVTVASYWCDINASDCQVTEVGPDLFANQTPPPPTPGVTARPDPVSAGAAIQFPADGYTVRNIGNRPAKERRYGYYLSKAVGDSVLHLLPNGQVDPAYDILLGSDLFTTPLLPFTDPTTPGTFDSIAPRALTIPSNTVLGEHYVFLYADDLRKVSETHEENNVVKVKITVVPPRYQLIGLFSPCSGLTCGPRNGGAATPISFQLSFDGVNAVDSFATKPRLKFYDSTGALLFTAAPDDVAPGGSDWKYSSNLTWQYNWQTKNPITGQSLPAGTYLIKVEVPATQQIDGAGGVGSVATITMTVR